MELKFKLYQTIMYSITMLSMLRAVNKLMPIFKTKRTRINTCSASRDSCFLCVIHHVDDDLAGFAGLRVNDHLRDVLVGVRIVAVGTENSEII